MKKNLQREETWEKQSRKKFLDPKNIEEAVSKIRKESLTLATLNGSFDLLHAGHLHILYEASLQADILIVALNSDRSIQLYKGASRPFIPLNYRLQLVAALEFVDWVTWFEESDPRKILSRIRPDIHVNGAEYGEHCIEAETVRSCGGRLHLVSRIASLSTSALIEKIQKTSQGKSHA